VVHCLQAYLASRVLPNGDSMKALRIDGSTSLEDRCRLSLQHLACSRQYTVRPDSEHVASPQGSWSAYSGG
jgi:hypothetical protein